MSVYVRQAIRWMGALIAFLSFHVATTFASDSGSSADLSIYLYEETRLLVSRVEAAAARFSAEGTNAFPAFVAEHNRDTRFTLFVYDQDVTCVYHEQYPDFVGRNLLDLKDLQGRPMGLWTQAIGRQPDPKAHGWVFYYWRDADAFDPKWKASYIRKTTAPDGRVYEIGCGMVNMKVEKSFIQKCVDLAAQRLQDDGSAAFADLKDPASPYNVLDTHIFVLDPQGRAVVDPASPGSQGRDLTEFRDVTDKKVFQTALERLQTEDTVWTQYLWPKPDAVRPSRKILYLRKVVRGDEQWIVGTSFFLATPIWMRL